MVDLNADPASLNEAAAGINGIIDELGGTGVTALYTAGAGRGFGSLQLDGKTIGHADPQSGLTDYCHRWEWGVRALVQGARKISQALNLGADAYAREDKYLAKNLRGSLNDVFGDPNLQRRSYTDPVTQQKVLGTDDMSLGEVFSHNKNALSNPDWDITPADRKQIAETYSESWQSIRSDAPEAAKMFTNPLEYGMSEAKDLAQNGIASIEPQADGPGMAPTPAGN